MFIYLCKKYLIYRLAVDLLDVFITSGLFCDLNWKDLKERMQKNPGKGFIGMFYVELINNVELNAKTVCQ